MIVARQFIAWNVSKTATPSRRVRSDPCPRLTNRPDRSTPSRPNHTVPYGTVSSLHEYQAINCLATIGRSLRDKNRPYRCADPPSALCSFLNWLR